MARQTTRFAVPDGLESPRAKLVYLYLSTQGVATVDELKRDLAMTKLCLLSVLSTLQDRGFVRRDDDEFAPA